MATYRKNRSVSSCSKGKLIEPPQVKFLLYESFHNSESHITKIGYNKTGYKM